jgi:Rad3-related DNA helicase
MSYTVAVRALCEFTAKQGDLDLRFTPSATALEGVAGHALAASRRGERYEREVALAGEHAELRVRGRADGFAPDAGRLDEVKTYRGDLARMPANRRALHWAQARVYGALLCRARGLAALRVALVYLDVATGGETVLCEQHDAAALEAFFVEQCERFLGWARQEAAHRGARDAALAGLAFPHARFRAGQRTLAEGVYRSAAAGRTLLAQAPTGIGKTLGTLYPQLKAMPGQRLDKIVYLAAKTPGRGLALDALRTLLRGLPRPGEDAAGAASEADPAPVHDAVGAVGAVGAPVRVLELVARDKSCEHPDRQCHGGSCPLARGFYDRLPAARQAAVDVDGADSACLDRDRVRSVALAHGICPYYLSHELVRWADVVVGDYNYWFDASAMLHGLALAHEWRVALLVDEAHNLVGRARDMYSASLRRRGLDEARSVAPAVVAPSLRRLARAWNAVLDGLAQPVAAYTTFDDPPAGLVGALQSVASAIADFQATQDADGAPVLAPELLQFFFDVLRFTRLAESFGRHSLFDLTIEDGRGERDSTVCLRNLVPAPFLKARFAAARTATLFSATLSPWHYHADLLGLPEDVAWLDVASPFDAAQLTISVQPVSTRYADREESVEPIVALIAHQFDTAPGNYLAFFSSFDYLRQVLALLRERHPRLPAWEQSRGMDEGERVRFLARFHAGGQGIGFAVLGGAFAEGIDLPGDRLVGAFIATLGLPQVNPVNECIRTRLDELFGAGHEYTYLYPGLQKVVQAAGRVIRAPTDRGVVHLIDDRYRRNQVRRLLPAWWNV